MPQGLLALFSDDCTLINELMSYQKKDGMVYYFHGGLPVFCHAEQDEASFRMFTSQLYVNGTCTQSQIVKAFGVTPISVKRAVKKYRDGHGLHARGGARLCGHGKDASGAHAFRAFA